MKKRLRVMFIAMCFVVTLVPIAAKQTAQAADGVSYADGVFTVTGEGEAEREEDFTQTQNDEDWLTESPKNTWTITVTNNTDKEMTIIADYKIKSGSTYHKLGETIFYNDIISPDGNKSFTNQNGTFENTYSCKLAAGATQELKCVFIAQNTFYTVDFKANVKITAISSAGKDAFTPSYDSDKPLMVEPGKTYVGSTVGVAYFALDLKTDSVVKVETTGSSDDAYVNDGVGSTDKVADGSLLVLHKGLKIFPARGNTLKLKFTVEEYDYGTVQLNWPNGANSVIAGTPAPYSIDFTAGKNFGADNKSRILDVSWTDTEGNMVPKDAVAGNQYNAVKPGRFNVTVLYGYSDYGDAKIDINKQQVFTVDVTPATPPVKNVTASGTHNSLKIKFDSDGNYIYGSPVAQIYLNGNWVDMDGNQKSGLKDNTTYKFRVVGCTPAAGGAPELRSAPSPEFSATTASKQKPVIKSIKVKKVKYVHHKGSWSGGYWVGNDWIPKKWIKPFYTTNITLQVKLKKKIPGSNSVNVFAKAGSATAYRTKVGKGLTSFTVELSVMDKYKGTASVSAQSSSDKAGLIVGPRSATKKVKIKKK